MFYQNQGRHGPPVSGLARFLVARRLHRPRAWDPVPARSATAIRAFHRHRYSGRAGSASAPPPNPAPRFRSRARRSSPYRRATAGFPCSVPDRVPFAWIAGSAPMLVLADLDFFPASRFGRFGLGFLWRRPFSRPSSSGPVALGLGSFGCGFFAAVFFWQPAWSSWRASPPTAPAPCSARERRRSPERKRLFRSQRLAPRQDSRQVGGLRRVRRLPHLRRRRNRSRAPERAVAAGGGVTPSQM